MRTRGCSIRRDARSTLRSIMEMIRNLAVREAMRTSRRLARRFFPVQNDRTDRDLEALPIESVVSDFNAASRRFLDLHHQRGDGPVRRTIRCGLPECR